MIHERQTQNWNLWRYIYISGSCTTTVYRPYLALMILPPFALTSRTLYDKIWKRWNTPSAHNLLCENGASKQESWWVVNPMCLREQPEHMHTHTTYKTSNKASVWVTHNHIVMANAKVQVGDILHSQALRVHGSNFSEYWWCNLGMNNLWYLGHTSISCLFKSTLTKKRFEHNCSLLWSKKVSISKCIVDLIGISLEWTISMWPAKEEARKKKKKFKHTKQWKK